MTLAALQQNMRQAYLNGASGALASGLIWGVAALAANLFSPIASMLTLFFGGMLIFPLSVVISKLGNASGKHDPSNMLKHLAVENLGFLFAGLMIAFVVAQQDHMLFYPIMLLAIGARYLTFQTIYGVKTYWLFGGSLMIAGALCMVMRPGMMTVALLGSVIELIFSLVLWQQHKATNDATI
ncbi:hypothetical protein [Bowmanella sp. JS7-9]|uniref:DUF7010 family protein n=1 Tax=Pseudobowmanella zhangzhouensis TaxID=1537679 RepID=A0ABW1XH84_9ALTE|nr:hypothetical protein [Bowmanella sp. JS7-9]TBX21047.1 hypothetical protein TK45_12870 [Bowmanella sp. JS7-9]